MSSKHHASCKERRADISSPGPAPHPPSCCSCCAPSVGRPARPPRRLGNLSLARFSHCTGSAARVSCFQLLRKTRMVRERSRHYELAYATRPAVLWQTHPHPLRHIRADYLHTELHRCIVTTYRRSMALSSSWTTYL